MSRDLLYPRRVRWSEQERLPPALIGIVLRTRADAPVMLEGGIIESHDLVADRHSSLRQFLVGFIRPAAHLDLHVPRPIVDR